MKTETTPFDPAEYLGADEDQIDILRDAFTSGDAAYIANAIGVVARARNVSRRLSVRGVLQTPDDS